MKENVYYSLRSGLIFDKYKSCYFEKVFQQYEVYYKKFNKFVKN